MDTAHISKNNDILQMSQGTVSIPGFMTRKCIFLILTNTLRRKLMITYPK